MSQMTVIPRILVPGATTEDVSRTHADVLRVIVTMATSWDKTTTAVWVSMAIVRTVSIERLT